MGGINLYEMQPFWSQWGVPVEVIFFAKVIVLAFLILTGSWLKRLYDRKRKQATQAASAAPNVAAKTQHEPVRTG